jgi:hypothetical protein
MSGDIEETYFYIGLGEIRSEGRIATQRPCRDVSKLLIHYLVLLLRDIRLPDD